MCGVYVWDVMNSARVRSSRAKAISVEPTSGRDATDECLLEVRGISKAFPGTVALRGVDFEVRSGEIHALVGENGAGKSTLIKILAGVYQADSGLIKLRGVDFTPGSGRGIAFVHQDLGLFPPYSVAENIAVVAGYGQRAGLISWRETQKRARDLLRTMGSTVDPEQEVGGLASADRAIVAIARGMALEAAVLVLDEPTAALPETDVRRLLGALRELRERGTGIVFVTHRLDEVFRVSDRITVLRDGHRISTRVTARTTPKELVRDIVGRELTQLYREPPPPREECLLRLDEIRIGPSVGPISLKLHEGEILALVGLRGAGPGLLARALFGAAGRAQIRGVVMVNGTASAPRSPRDAIRVGIGFVSANRGEEGLAGRLTVRENIYPNPGLDRSTFWWRRHRAERRRAEQAIATFDVRPADPERTAGSLSGGNQQKMVLARWLEARSKLLILEEPTFGVDIGARAEIYALLVEHAARGGGILLVSSDFDEVVGLSHRAIVLRRGAVVGELCRKDLSVSALTDLASGASASGVEGEGP